MKNIFIEQNLHWQDKTYSSVKREALDKLISYLPLKQIITITGLRRCGKSTLAKQAINYLVESGVDKKNIFFINLEHPYFLEFRHDANFLNVIYDAYVKLMDPEGKTYFIMDEIQYFENWQVFVKSKYETSDIKFIVTGSNSSMLSNELNTLLSGRSLNIHLDTFSFREFLDYKGIGYRDELSRTANKIAIDRAKEEYITWGGFFEVFEQDDASIKRDILLSYAKNIIYQDIVPRFGIRNSQTIERVFFYLLSNITGVLNYTTLAKTFDISDKTVKEYIRYFEDVFLLKRIDRFHTKQKESIKSTKKIYLLDNGFLQIAPRHSKNQGAALENTVFIELNKRCDVTYMKERYEIDFKCTDTLYQVSYKLLDDKTTRRELRAFEHLDKDKKFARKLITFDKADIQREDISSVSIEEFLIDEADREL